MSHDHTDPPADAANPATPEANGHPAAPRPEADPVRERFRLRAQCAKLRHWCQGLLDAEGTEGVLPADVERELRETAPGMSMDEVFASLRIISQGEPLPPGAADLTGDVAALAVERERLRKLFFALHDTILPWDEITEEYLLEQRAAGPMLTLEEAIEQIEREFGGRP